MMNGSWLDDKWLENFRSRWSHDSFYFWRLHGCRKNPISPRIRKYWEKRRKIWKKSNTPLINRKVLCYLLVFSANFIKNRNFIHISGVLQKHEAVYTHSCIYKANIFLSVICIAILRNYFQSLLVTPSAETIVTIHQGIRPRLCFRIMKMEKSGKFCQHNDNWKTT